MNVRRGFLSLVAVLGLPLGVQALFYQGTALGQPEVEELSMRNPLIDCSTNPAYDDEFIASAFRAGGGHVGGRYQQCNACHKSDNPTVGTGDRPVALMGTSLVHNRLSEPISYSVKVGEKGEWESYELNPGAVRRHSYKYSRPNQNRSPDLRIKYTDQKGREKEHQLKLVATPNPKLGSVYFFDLDNTKRQVQLKVSGVEVSRR